MLDPITVAVLIQIERDRQRNLAAAVRSNGGIPAREWGSVPRPGLVVLVGDSLIAVGRALKGRSQPTTHHVVSPRERRPIAGR